ALLSFHDLARGRAQALQKRQQVDIPSIGRSLLHAEARAFLQAALLPALVVLRATATEPLPDLDPLPVRLEAVGAQESDQVRPRTQLRERHGHEGHTLEPALAGERAAAAGAVDVD